MSLRSIKAQARMDLHRGMQVQALYIPPNNGTPVPCRVRVHTKFTQLGDQKGTSLNSAESEEQVPRLVFHAPEVIPERGGRITINPREGYIVGVTVPADDMNFIHARVAPLTAAQLASLPMPPSDPSEYPEPQPEWEQTEW
jgi:hypothetical protein